MNKSKIAAAVLFCFLFTAAAYADFIDYLMQPTTMAEENMPMQEINFKVGFDFDGTFSTNKKIDGIDDKELDVESNASFAAEYYRYFNAYIAAGAGVSAEAPRWVDEISGSFGFMPAYIAVKVRSIPQEPGMYGYVLGQFGYSFFYTDSSFDDELKKKDGGIYYGLGLGMVYESFLIEGIYSVSQCSAEDKTGNKINVDYGKWTISVGYKI